jgi:glycolate oxidase FAD binding subunit
LSLVLTEAIASRFANAVGGSYVRTESAGLAGYEIDGALPVISVQPATAEEASAIVRIAVEEKCSVIPCGARSSLAIGLMPARYDVALDMTRVEGIVHYDPGDLTISVNAGTRLATLSKVLADKKQFLPLEVPFFEKATVGGAIASGLDSPLRHFYGTARDFVIGAEFVDGTGAIAKSGGRVVKNVTGYDFHKLMIGSLGSLAVITRVNFRTFPLPISRRGFVASFVEVDGAFEFMRDLVASPLAPGVLEVISRKFVDLFLGERSSATSLFWNAQAWTVCVGFEGSNEVCERYERDLARLARTASAQGAAAVNDSEFAELLNVLREAPALMKEGGAHAVVLRLVTLPGNVRELLKVLSSFASSSQISCAVLVRSASIVYVAVSPGDGNETALKQIASLCKSIETLRKQMVLNAAALFCPRQWKAELSVWNQTADALDIARRVKNSFDPGGTFASGRFVGGI